MQPRVELASQPMRVEAYLTPFSVLAELPRLGRAYSLSAYSLQICSPWFYSPGVAQAQEQRSALVRDSAHEAELFFAQPAIILILYSLFHCRIDAPAHVFCKRFYGVCLRRDILVLPDGGIRGWRLRSDLRLLLGFARDRGLRNILRD